MQQPVSKYLLAEIQAKVPDSPALAKLLIRVLHISSSSVYRKIGGEVPFTLEEMLTIARYFQISIDKYVLHDEVLSNVKYSALSHSSKNPVAYLETLLNHAEQIVKLPEPEIWYASQEIPVFYYGLEPDLLAFKLFMWSRMGNIEDSSMTQRFAPDSYLEASPEIQLLGMDIFNRISSLPVLELWSGNYLLHTLRQIQAAHYDKMLVSENVAEILLDGLVNLLNQLETMATHSTRRPGESANMKIYYNDIAYTNNTVLVRSQNEPKAVLASFDNPHFVVFSNPDALWRMQNWLESIRRKSVMISGGERHRIALFEHYRDEVERTREKVRMGEGKMERW